VSVPSLEVHSSTGKCGNVISRRRSHHLLWVFILLTLFARLGRNRNLTANPDEEEEESGTHDDEARESSVVTQNDLDIRLRSTYKLDFVKGTSDSFHRVTHRDAESAEREREAEAEVNRKRKERWDGFLEKRFKPAAVFSTATATANAAAPSVAAAVDHPSSPPTMPTNETVMSEPAITGNGPGEMDVD
jgi:hypothetical protein